MELFHTSPTEITTVNRNGRFGEFLFFSQGEYVTTAGSHVCYQIELADDEVIDASRLFWHKDAGKLDALVTELAHRFGVDESDAANLIDESANIYALDSGVDAEDLAEASWDIQLFTARAAKLLGFRAVAVLDEQGTAYMVDMLGREAEMCLV